MSQFANKQKNFCAFMSLDFLFKIYDEKLDKNKSRNNT